MTRFSKWLNMQPFYETPGDPGGGGGAPGAAPAGTTTPPPAGAPAAAAPPSGTGGAPGAAAAPGGERPTFAYPEDRSKWIPPHRWDEQSRRLSTLEQANQTWEKKVRTLMGVAEPEDPRMVEVKNALRQVSPALGKLLDRPELMDRFEQFLEQDYPQMAGGQEAYANRLAFETTSVAVEEYAKAVGTTVDKLPENRVQLMARQLGSFIAADASGERQRRYDMRDPSIVSELVSELTGFFVAPRTIVAGQQTAEQVERARRLPQQGPRGAVPPPAGTTERPKDKKSIHEAARQALLAGGGS